MASLRALGGTLAELVGTRAELALVELQQHGARRKEALVLALGAGLFLGLGLLLAALFVVAWFWDTHRLAAIAGMALLYLAIAAALYVRLRARERDAPPPFEATLQELAKDREMLRGSHE